MEIGFVTEKYPPDAGGLSVSAGRLAGMLAVAGHRVRVFVPGSPGAAQPPETGPVAGLTVFRLPDRRREDDTLQDCFDTIVAQNRQGGFDLLHGFFLTRAGFLAAYAGAFLGIPSVGSIRGNDLDRAIFDPGRAAHIIYALQQAGALTANTREQMRKAEALAPGRPVEYIPNGVDGGLFCPVPRPESLAAELGLGGRLVVGFAGEARAKKGLAQLLLAFRETARTTPAGLLLLGGARPGPDLDLLQVFIRQNPDLPVIATGYLAQEELPAYYALMDVLALPSLHDGLPNSLLEGMACGRAIAGTPVGGIGDVLRHGVNGRLVPVGEVEALAVVLVELLNDLAGRERLGRQARADVQENFTRERELAGYLALYRRLTGRANLNGAAAR